MNSVRGKIAVALLAATVIIGGAHSSAPALAQGEFREDFEGVEPSWQILAADTQYRIDERQRVREPVHTGAWSESLVVTAADGTFIHYGRQIGAARIIDELNVSVWVFADRPGLQWIARVVLPRSADPQTGRPWSLLIYGPIYERPGTWQELTLDQLPQRIERQVRLLQTTVAAPIDAREAIIDAVMLNVYGGRGTTRVWLDDLSLSGFVGPRPAAAPAGANVAPAALAADDAGRWPPAVLLRGAVLTVGGRPFLPRIIEHRGESLAALKRLGFSGIKIPTPPDGPLLSEAAEAQMWIICPPPPLGSGSRIGHEYDPVLAWDLGQSLSHRQLAAAEAEVRQLREADRQKRRPVLGDAATELKLYSELADVLAMGRRTLGTSLELADYAMWLRQRARLARPGTPVWINLETQPDPMWQAQIAAFSAGFAPPSALGSREFRQLVFTVLAGGARGIVFESRDSLEAADPATRHRAAMLQLINLELSLVEGWAAAGSFVTPATATDAAISPVVVETDRARLLLPLRSSRGDQYVVDEGPNGDATFVVPGVPESNEVLELTPAGLRPLAHRRVTGGMSVTLRDPAPAPLVVLTQDPQVIDNLTRAAGAQRHTAAELTRQLAADELALVEETDRRLAGQSLAAQAAPKLLGTARELMKKCDAAVAAGDDVQALTHGRGVMRAIGQLARAHWLRAAPLLGSPLVAPSGASFSTLPISASFVDALRVATVGNNLLPAGDFEDLDQLRGNGWQHFQLPQRLVRTGVELSNQGPHSGALCLRLINEPQPDQPPPAILESPPLWVTSAPVAAAAGQVVQIHGWVRVPRPITGSVDGLLIVDSLGGEALAERIGQTRGWHEFTLYRAAPTAGKVTVTFALSGLGEALVDDVTVRVVTLPQWNQNPQAAGWAPVFAPPRWR